MPSKRKKTTKSSKKKRTSRSSRSRSSSKKSSSQVQQLEKMNKLFWPLVVLSLVLWIVYRSLFDYPVWFDETLGKAIFFGLPAWFFVSMTQVMAIPDSFSFSKMRSGLLQGIAFGGVFGFAATIASLFSAGAEVQQVSLFMADVFWWEFFLALLTGFWETLFFYSFIMTVIQLMYSKWSLLQQILLTSLIFIIFHVPNLLQLFGGYAAAYILLIWVFSVGQAFLYARQQNAYTLVLSQAIWGMVLLIHV